LETHAWRFLVGGLMAASLSAAAAPVWTPVGGPTGGDVRALAVDPRQPEVVYLGTADGVLYRSTDAGRAWLRLTPGFPRRGASLDDVIVDPRGRLWVGFWDVQGAGGGVARSDDGGRSFTLLAGIAGQPVRALALSASDPDVLVAGTLTGIWRTEDAGATWRPISPAGHEEIRNLDSIAIDPRDASTIYAGTWHLAWKTQDAGRTWKAIHAGMISDSDVMTLTIDRRVREKVYATACSGIYRSGDSAGRWSKVSGIPGSSRRTRAFAQDPEQPATFYAGTTEGLWRSRDDLGSWSLQTPKELVVNTIAALPGGTLLVGTDGAGVLRSEDRGTTWNPSNQGFAERFVSQVLFDRGRVAVALLGDRYHSGVMTAPALSGPWTPLGTGLEGREVVSVALVPNSPGAGTTLPAELLVGTDDGVFLSASHCGQWRRLPTVVGQFDPHPRIAAVAAASERVFLAATRDGLLRSTDAGETWTRRELGVARATTALAVAPADPRRVLAVTGLGVFMSSDAGASFAQIAAAPLDVPLTSLAFLPGQDQAVIATSAKGLVLSLNQGRSWMRRGGGLPLSNIASLALLPDGRTLYAGDFGHGGVYVSRDAGQSWQAVPTDGLASDRVSALAADPLRPGLVVAAPTSGGLHVLAAP
jgi:photosystem II stability/assembly factor-like uncharacterized protein